MAFYTRFNHKPCEGVVFSTPSLCQSQFKESCDIGNMIRRALSGDPSVFGRPKYLNVLNAPESFHDAQSRLALANTVWEELPDNMKQTYGTPSALLREIDSRIAMAAKHSTEKPADTSSQPATLSPSDKTDVSSTDTACA